MNEPAYYQKKPVVVQAMQLFGTATDTMAVCDWVRDNGYPWLLGNATQPETLVPEDGNRHGTGIYLDPATGELVIRTLEGDMRASYGDWVIMGIKGEFYPCKPDIFEATYALFND